MDEAELSSLLSDEVYKLIVTGELTKSTWETFSVLPYNYRNSFLYYAVVDDNVDFVEYFLNTGSEIESMDFLGTTSLMWGAIHGKLNAVKFLVKSNAIIDAGCKGHFGGYTALMFAARDGHLPVVQFFVESKADVNAKGDNGMTTLKLAEQNGHDDIVELLKTRKDE